VWLDDVVGVSFDTVKKIIVSRVEQFFDGWYVVTAVSEPFGTSQQRVETRAVSSRTHSRPRCVVPHTGSARHDPRKLYKKCYNVVYEIVRKLLRINTHGQLIPDVIKSWCKIVPGSSHCFSPIVPRVSERFCRCRCM